VAVSDASILEAKAAIAQDEAAAQRAQRNRDYCTIKSPVKGVIIDRRVNTGQTVVASLNAPSLFLLAKDLTRMQVWVAVNEADIGKIHPKQPVTFTVDAFPGQSFQGEVGKVRLNASMTQNVVTYTVEIITDNSAGQLLPYLTANVKFELDRRNNVLMVPNAALRWMPTIEQIQPEARDTATALVGKAKGVGARGANAASSGARGERSGGTRGSASADSGRGPQAKIAQPQTAGKNAMSSGMVWAVEGKYVRPIAVQVGQNDGAMTEVQGEGLSEGLDIVVGVQAKATAQADATNPFAPRFPSRGGTRGGGGGGGGGGGMGGARGGGGAGGPSR
jgi:HlyD family secretion protein